MDYWVDKDEILSPNFEAVFNSFLLSETGYLRMKRVFIERLRDIINK